MKVLLFLIAFGFTDPALAASQRQDLVSLYCTGANGLEIALEAGSSLVETRLGLYRKNFESNRQVFIYEKNGIRITRIALGRVGASHSYVYDIYLADVPAPGVVASFEGVIGKTIYGAVVFPVYPAPVPVPLGFVASTSLQCSLLTE